MKKQNGAELLVNCLIQHGVRYVFGIPGAKVDAVFEALRLAKKDIQLIVCRHEQNAAFMAAMVGRLTGQPGVVIVTSGPGVTNLATGLLTATSEGDPVVAIGANVARTMRLKQTHQGLDNAMAMKAVTRDSVEVLVPQSIPEAVANAFRTASSGNRGAAFISIPQDVLTEKIALPVCPPPAPVQFGTAPQALLQQAADMIRKAQFPIVLLGMQASQPQHAAAIQTLLHHHCLPVVCTFQAAGVVPRDLISCFVGRVGLFKNQPGDQALAQADVVLTIGYNPIEYDPEIWNNDICAKKIIHLDQVPAEIHLTYSPQLELIGDIAANVHGIRQLLEKNSTLPKAEDLKKLQKNLRDKIEGGRGYQGKRVHPLRFIHDLQTCIDDDTTIISDIGTHYIWLARYLFSYKPHHLLFSNGQQTLGVALPWAIATRLIRPWNKIISVSGDGGFLFSAMELETAVREKCHFVHCVWRDGTYNMVLEQQLMKYGHGSGVELGKVDLVDFAKSFGAQGYAVHNSSELLPVLQEALQQKVPVLIDIPIDYSDNSKLFKTVHTNIGN